ncbi:tetratricopeptide repeat protein [Goodfellowiella coeruleoviolacea]|nr:tetratricopeptide repeat protein [Goodfellowiella coeruleoviolacea]
MAVDAAVRRWDAGDRVGGERALRDLVESPDVDVASAAALGLAVRLVGVDPEDAITVGCRALDLDHPVNQRRAGLVLGWANLALDDPAAAWTPLQFALGGSEPDVAGWAAVLHGLVSVLVDETPVHIGAWHIAWQTGVPRVVALLERLDATRDLSTQLTDEVIWSHLPWGSALSAQRVLPRLLRNWSPEHGCRAALGLHVLHRALGLRDAARRSAAQVVSVGLAPYLAPAWLSLAESSLLSGDRVAARHACQRAIETARPGQRTAAHLFTGDAPGPDVLTSAKTLLGSMLRDAGDIDQALVVLADLADSDDPDALFVRAQTFERARHDATARELYLKVVDRDTPHTATSLLSLGVIAYRAGDNDTAWHWWQQAVDVDDPEVAGKAAHNLGLIAKDRRDLPAALKWFGRVIDSGHAEGALAAAHLGELCYWLDDQPAALNWYQRTLAGTDDPELVAEAAYRAAEILVGRGDPVSARPLLERAVDTAVPAFAQRAAVLLAGL